LNPSPAVGLKLGQILLAKLLAILNNVLALVVVNKEALFRASYLKFEKSLQCQAVLELMDSSPYSLRKADVRSLSPSSWRIESTGVAILPLTEVLVAGLRVFAQPVAAF
jgi:hypothetical protein